ncbi:hypothetical protein SAMN05192544_1015120 [Paraburkholderia hospita]|nr:hypothetical protein SAMN05192544_1015120 [Paraburkholderia hospita]SKC87962.1 hypothetical protein SAMN05445504_5216 [Burkholderia sp. CF099]
MLVTNTVRDTKKKTSRAIVRISHNLSDCEHFIVLHRQASTKGYY